MTNRCAVLARAAVAAGVLWAAAAGCSKPGTNDDYAKMMQAKQGASDSLAASGAKFKEKQYGGKAAWAVDLHGLTITDDLLRQVKTLGNVAELDLSKSTVTDAHLATMRELELHALLNRLDLSNTAVTDVGLEKLDGNLFLAELNLTGTKVTPAGVARFKQARQANPNTRIKNTNVRL